MALCLAGLIDSCGNDLCPPEKEGHVNDALCTTCPGVESDCQLTKLPAIPIIAINEPENIRME